MVVGSISRWRVCELYFLGPWAGPGRGGIAILFERGGKLMENTVHVDSPAAACGGIDVPVAAVPWRFWGDTVCVRWVLYVRQYEGNRFGMWSRIGTPSWGEVEGGRWGVSRCAESTRTKFLITIQSTLIITQCPLQIASHLQ